MATYRACITSPRPPADVFEYMARFSNAAEWDPGVTGADDLGPTVPAIGSAYPLMVRSFGRVVPLEYRVTELERPRRVVVQAENSMVRSTDAIEVAPVPSGGSRLTYQATLELKGAALLFTPLLGPSFRRIGDRAMVGLRTVLQG